MGGSGEDFQNWDSEMGGKHYFRIFLEMVYTNEYGTSKAGSTML